MTELQKDIRIVIPAFKAIDTIQKCIDAVLDAISFHESWEIIIVDNGQNPDLIKLLKDYPVTVLKQDENQSAAFARNEGAKGFLNGILVFIDSDVVCEKDCIDSLIKPIQNNLCNATIGNYSKNIKGLSFSQKYKQLYINHIYSREGSKIKNDFWTAICSVDAKVFNKLSGFNTNFKGANGEDQEFGIRLTKNGYNVLSVRNANGQHLNPYGILNIIRNDFRKGLTAVKNSLENKVPFSDNRHSKIGDILAVFFAVMTVTFLTISVLNSDSLFGSIATFLLWFICRISLNITFFKNGGVIFFIRTLLLMFCLDLIRCTCVIIGFVKNKLLKVSTNEETNVVSIRTKSWHKTY
ncbi:MAG: glycosyltransferase family 2 protein [Bacteroidetes bacterium]|nr:glycosyltransferase family 2 protein [Bacteroidota bacterium]